MDATLLVPIGLGITVIGAALGIGKFAAAAAEAILVNQKQRTRLVVLCNYHFSY